jgi:Rad3-related DNA helicase
MVDGELPRIGPYITTTLLGGSSTSRYYLSKSLKGKRDAVHIKRLTVPLSSPEAKQAFLQRGKQLGKLSHRNIVTVQDVGLDDDYGYLVMDAVSGETIRHTIPEGKQVAPSEAKTLLSQLADALHKAHTAGIIHGNVHPGNVSLSLQHNPLLTEFSLTTPNITPLLDDIAFAVPYMSPEQLRGEPLTPASDQYALAVLLYEWLCGRRPYDATERELLLVQQEHTQLPHPSTLNGTIKPAIEQVLLQALSVKPEQRFENVHLFSTHYLHALLGLPAPKENASSIAVPARVVPSARVNVAPVQALPLSSVTSHADSMTSLKQERVESARPVSLSTMPKIERIKKRSESNSDSSYPTPATTLSTPLPAYTSSADDERVSENGKQTSSELHNVGKEQKRSKATSDAGEDSASSEQLQHIVTHDLRQGGILSKKLPGYEERPAQIEMANMVARSLMQNVPTIIEAGTGTGKSQAYLIPTVRSGKVAIISTANKALQEQLFYKDIPFVQQHIKHFEAALVKGVGNYVCLDRLENERVGMQFFAKNVDFKRLVDITNDPDAAFTGDFETLGFQLPSDIRGKVATDSDQCAWSKCNFFADCYVRQMRENAERAQVIVVNHTLLLLDAAMGGFLLPDRDVIILDEAHHLEEEATRSFTITIGPNQIQTLLAQKLLRNHSQLSLQDEAMRVSNATWMRLSQVADPGFKGRTNLEKPLEEGLKLATTIGDLADSLRRQRPKDLPDKEGQLYDKLLKRTQNLAENIRTVFSVAQPTQFVYYVERVQSGGRNNVQLQVSAAPLDVTNWLRERLFDKCNVICTSATLATVGPNPVNPDDKGPNFAYFRKRIGLDPVERPDVLETILPLAFDYEQNALLYIPRDLPEPTYGAGSDDYMKSIAREMYKLVKASHGRAFLLFSSKRMLDRAYELMSPHLDYPLLKQGDMTRLELTRRFREEKGAVLFGLKSFWEGVDIAGDALSLVVIDKLPFDPPDDPVHEARVAHMKAAGENWFGTYVLPQAVLRLKQGIGRLLRTREDRGVMAILDTRLHTKGYGKMVLNALPPAKRTMNIKEVERFFS